MFTLTVKSLPKRWTIENIFSDYRFLQHSFRHRINEHRRQKRTNLNPKNLMQFMDDPEECSVHKHKSIESQGPTFSVLEKTPVESTQSSTPWIWTLKCMKLKWEYIRRAKAKTDENVRKSRGLEWCGGVEVEWGSLYNPPPPSQPIHIHDNVVWHGDHVLLVSPLVEWLRIDVVITWAGEGEHNYVLIRQCLHQ